MSVFTLWSDDVDQIWLKSRTRSRTTARCGRCRVDRRRSGADPVNATARLGRPGPGRTGSRTSAVASCRALATRSSRNTSSTGDTAPPLSRRFFASATGFARCCTSQRSARSPRTTCWLSRSTAVKRSASTSRGSASKRPSSVHSQRSSGRSSPSPRGRAGAILPRRRREDRAALRTATRLRRAARPPRPARRVP